MYTYFPNLDGDGDCGISEIAGVPLRKGPAWRSTGSERVFICFGFGECFREVFEIFFPSFPFAQELQTSLISKKLLFSVSRDAHAPQMRNSLKSLARILDKRNVLQAYS